MRTAIFLLIAALAIVNIIQNHELRVITSDLQDIDQRLTRLEQTVQFNDSVDTQAIVTALQSANESAYKLKLMEIYENN